MGEWILEVETEEDPAVECMEDEMRIGGMDIGFDMHACEKPVRRKEKKGEGPEVVRRSTVVTWRENLCKAT
jgi:hypothetical protein